MVYNKLKNMDYLRISTITGTGALDTLLDLDELFKILEISDIIHYMDYGCNNYKGYSKKLEKKKRKKKNTKVFYNQITLHFFHINKIVNVKLFNNGHIQMTGLKDISHLRDIIESIVSIISSYNRNEIIFSTNKNPSIIDTSIALINSDFDIKFEINREVLHREILNNGTYSTYEPCIYPGVNIKYFHNHSNTGACCCEGPCDGKGKNGACKKITIAVFKSGKVIITGANSLNQLDIAYHFIHKFLTDKKELIKI